VVWLRLELGAAMAMLAEMPVSLSLVLVNQVAPVEMAVMAERQAQLALRRPPAT